MSEALIKFNNVTKDYGAGRGIFDVSFELYRNETLGFVGSNGAGKTTTIRNIMGFIKADSGTVDVMGHDPWKESSEIMKHVGYVPGEIAFPDLPSGTDLIKSQAEFMHVTDFNYAKELTAKLQLDLTANLKRMSKGMKQKTAIVAALIGDPEILILDEPTTGLDPLMRTVFLDVMEEEKKKGKTILMSSHLYEELEKICDRVAVIDRGRIIDIVDMNKILNRGFTDYKIEFNTPDDFNAFKKEAFEIVRVQEKYSQVTVSIKDDDVNTLFSSLKKYNVKFITEVKYNLEKHINKLIADYYKEKKDVQ